MYRVTTPPWCPFLSKPRSIAIPYCFSSIMHISTISIVATFFLLSPLSSASNSFAGTNNYFLHGLPTSDQDTYLSTLSSWGVKLIRLWVSQTPAGCVKGSTDVQAIPPLESTVGIYDTTVLDKLDATLALLKKHNIKALLSPHDANVISGANGCDAYCTKYGNQETFYASTEGKADYDARLKTIFNYVSPNFGVRWGDLSSVVWGFDIQNEPFTTATDKLSANDPDDWLCGRAGNMRPLLNDDISINTGGIGGSQYCCDHAFNAIPKALACDAIDVISMHGYMDKASDWAYYINGSASVVAAAKAHNKLALVEEWGVKSTSTDGFDRQVQVFNDNGVPWLYWQVVPGLDQTQSGAPSSCGYDGFEIGVASGKGDVKDAVAAADAATAEQNWEGAHTSAL